MVDIVRSCLNSRTLLQSSWSHHLPLHPDGRLTLGDVEGPSGVVLALRCIVTPSRIRYGPIDVVLDSLPDQCAKDHTSTEMPVSHATYDKPKVLDFRVVQMWRRPMQLPAKKTPTLNRAPRRNCRTGPDSYDQSHALWVHLPIQLHAAWPVPLSRSAWHSTARGWSETFRNTGAQSNERYPFMPLMACCVSSHRTMAMHEWVVYRAATEPLQDRRASHHARQDDNMKAPPRGWLC